jgi:hypothetical protein
VRKKLLFLLPFRFPAGAPLQRTDKQEKNKQKFISMYILYVCWRNRRKCKTQGGGLELGFNYRKKDMGKVIYGKITRKKYS